MWFLAAGWLEAGLSAVASGFCVDQKAPHVLWLFQFRPFAVLSGFRFPIERHILVKGAASPDDPKLKEYWLKRSAAKATDLTPSKQKLSQRQKGRCVVCGESLFNDELLEVHHKLPKGKGGASSYSNLELIHLNCHQQLTYGAG